MKVKNTITQEKFQTVKLLQEAGLTKAKIIKIVGISYLTVARICESTTLEEYKRKSTEYNKKVGSPAPRIEQIYSTPVANTDMGKVLTNLYEKLEQIEEKQDSIIGKVKWIEDNVEVRSKRKFF